MYIWITYNFTADYIEHGFTADEAATIIPEITVNAIERTLQSLNHTTKKIGNLFELIKHLQQGQRCDLVFNLADGSIGSGREALIPALLDAYKIPYTFSEPGTLAICTNKAFSKQFAQQAGIKTAPFSIVKKLDDISSINLNYPLFLKPSMAGRSLGINTDSLVLKSDDLLSRCAKLLEKYNQPILVEEYLPGREFSVGIVGQSKNTAALGVIEISSNYTQKIFYYDRNNKINSHTQVKREIVTDNIAKQCEAIGIQLWKALDCRGIGRVDLRCDKNGEPNFVEINTIPGLHPEHSDIVVLAQLNNLSYQNLIEKIINNFV